MTTEVLRNMLYAGSQHARRPRLRRDGRGALPRRPVPRRGLGGGHHPPARVGAAGLAVGDGVQRRGVRRLAGDRARRHRRSSSRSTGRCRSGSTCWSGDRLLDLFVERRPTAATTARSTPSSLRLARDGGSRRHARTATAAPRPRRRGAAQRAPRRRAAPTSSTCSTREGLLPAIFFIFSRAGCDAAVAAVPARRAAADRRRRARTRSARIVEERCADLPDEDLDVLGYYEWLDGLERGVAAHHAGMLPTFKEVVEELFERRLVKAVFATETLALGINMPARSVVLEKLVKWNGETHADVTPGEYTQLTGRAGRRGIDVEGHAVVAVAAGPRPAALGGPRLAPAPIRCARASGRPTTWPSTSSSSSAGTARARCSSRRSRSSRPTGPSSGSPGRCARNEEALAGYREAMTCHLGDFEEYAGLRRALVGPRGRAVPRRAPPSAAPRRPPRWRSCGPATSSGCPAGRRAGLAVVLDPGLGDGGADGPRPIVLTAERQVAPAVAGRLPDAGRAAASGCGSRRRSTRATPQSAARPRRRRCATQALDDGPAAARAPARGRRPPTTPSSLELRAAHAARTPATAAPSARTTPAGPSATTGCAARPTQLERRVEQPHQHDRAHVRPGLRAARASSATSTATRSRRTGARLARLYTELDLLAAECLRDGRLGRARAGRAGRRACPRWSTSRGRPTTRSAAAAARTARAATALAEMVRAVGPASRRVETRPPAWTFLREPDLGFAWATYRWASGERLDDGAARGATCRPATSSAGPSRSSTCSARSPTRRCERDDDDRGAGDRAATARAAADLLRRGVVAYSSVACGGQRHCRQRRSTATSASWRRGREPLAAAPGA